MTATRIRPATEDDVPTLIALVAELAAYEREPESATATATQFTAALFPAQGAATAYSHVAEVRGDRGWQVAGMAVWFLSFSTWTGTNGIWLEDLFVRPQYRGLGLGRELLATLARICLERGYRRMEWFVLDWNEPALGFYRSLNAVTLDDWTRLRLDTEALQAIGSTDLSTADPAPFPASP